MTPTAWDFRNQLSIILNIARHGGKTYIDVDSENLHRQVKGHVESSPRLPVCREVMMKMMRGGDSILKEHDESLMIRYVLTATAQSQKK